jgi:hypothetical protein
MEGWPFLSLAVTTQLLPDYTAKKGSGKGV